MNGPANDEPGRRGPWLTSDMSGIETAVAFVAYQTGGAARILAIHRRRPDGLCAGCSTTPTRWPCSVAGIATAARNYRKPSPPTHQ